MSQQQKVKLPTQIIKFTPLTLRKDYDDGDYGLLTWSVRNGYPRITVFTQNKNKQSQGGTQKEAFDYNTMITAPFDYTTMASFLSLMETVINGDPDTKYQMACYNTKYVNGERTNEMHLQSTVTIGKDKDGIVYLAVIDGEKRKIKFDITLGDWHKLYINNELVSDPAMISKTFAKGYHSTASKLLFGQLITDGLKDNLAKPVSTGIKTTGNEFGLDDITSTTVASKDSELAGLL